MQRPIEVTSRIMKSIRSKDSKAELQFRRALFAEGVRYRIHLKRLPGTPDVVIVSSRVAVFVDGDFWHGNSWRIRGMRSIEQQFPTRTDFWVQKIERNMARDRRVTTRLRQDGWTVLRFWESDVFADTKRCVRKTLRAISRSRKLSQN